MAAICSHSFTVPSAAAARKGREKAFWIWCGDSPEEHNVWAWARRRFHYSGSPEAFLEISADLRYIVWINGQRIGFGPPKFHAQTPTIDRYEISTLLQRGENLIAVSVYSLGGVGISSCAPQRGALWVYLELGASSGVGSDGTWRMQRDFGYSGHLVAQRGCQPPSEHYDARKAILSGHAPELDESNWPFARVLETRDLRAELRDIPFMACDLHLPDRVWASGIAHFKQPLATLHPEHIAEAIRAASPRPDREQLIVWNESSLAGTPVTMRASALSNRESASIIWDFGRIWAGYPTLKVRGTPGTVMLLSYGEHLQAGRVNPAKSRLNYFDQIVLGDAPVEYRVTWPKCARYLQLHLFGGDATLEQVAWERSSYPVRRHGSFASDSPVLDQAVEISLHTVQLCMEDSYMDTPWRERGSWLGDDLIKARVAYTCFRDYALARRFLLHHARGQLPSGMLQGKYPANVTSDVSTWSLRFPPSLLEYCAESGDWELGRQLWPTLQRLLQWLLSLQTPNRLFQAPPVYVDAYKSRYNFIDWAPIEMRGINAAWNAFASDCLQAISSIARELQLHDEVKNISKLVITHRKAFQTHFWDHERGIFVNGLIDGTRTQRWGCHENILAVLYDLATPAQVAQILEQLQQQSLLSFFVADENDYDAELPGLPKISTVSLALSKYRWPEGAMVPIGTPYFATYLIDALCKLGMVPQALEYLEHHWGNFSRQGGTTGWETWNMEHSLSHGWASMPAVFAAQTLLGVERSGASSGSYRILPYVAIHNVLRGRVATPAGEIEVEWDGRTLSVDAPKGLRLEAGLPGLPEACLRVNGVLCSAPKTRVKNQHTYLCTEISAGRHQLEIVQ